MEVIGATIGPDSWKLSTINNIKLANAVIRRSDKFNDLGKELDPLPTLRDGCIQQGNAHILSYSRATRQVVEKVRDSFLETEKEIKTLLRGKENLEKALEYIRKDIIINRESSAARGRRPAREKELDGVNDLLEAERVQYKRIKRVLEAQLRSVQKELQLLDNARKRLRAVLSERSRVLDFICHTTTNGKKNSLHDQSRNREMTARPKIAEVNTLGPDTPESSKAMSLAADARQRSGILRKELLETLEQVAKLQKATYQTVNDGLTQKVAETITMKQQLHMMSGETRMARNRGERWQYATEVARGYTLGPVSSQDLTTRERLDRPMVKLHQRHPGNQLPEASEIVEGNDGLEVSLDAIGRNIGMLKMTSARMNDDIKSKKAGAEIDSSVVRLRRRKANYRWVIEN